MAAVQQRSPTETLSAESHKDDKFIESMEDEVRRCAEHLERRQSRKRSYRSLDRKANGYSSSATGSYFEGSESAAARSNNSRSKNVKTLPRSFTLPSDPEERSVLSPRIIAPGARSPRKSPERSKPHVFKFANSGMDGGYSSQQQQHVWEEADRYKGNSAPPEVSPFFSAGSGSCSRDNSVTPLQSPLGRMPIGAVASHSRRSSHSSSPPPAVPPKRSSASPPPVPPKPSSSKGRRRAKSYTPTSPKSKVKPRKIEVSSVRNESLRLTSPPPAPMDPALISKLSEDERKDSLEFPSAEVDLTNFHEKVLKAKSLLVESTGGEGVSIGVESSVDAEDYPIRQASAPPTLGSPADKLSSGSKGPSASIIGKEASTNTSSESGKGADVNEGHLLKGSPGDNTVPLPLKSVESSVDVVVSKPGDASKVREVINKVMESTSNVSLGDPSSCPSNSDLYISDPSMRDSEISVLTTNSEQSAEKEETVLSGYKRSQDEVFCKEDGAKDIEQNMDELLEKLSAGKAKLLSDTSPTLSVPSSSRHTKSSEQEEGTDNLTSTDGNTSTQEAEIKSSDNNTPLTSSVAAGVSSELETKSISQLAHMTAGKHGSQRVQRVQRGGKHARHSQTPSSEGREIALDTPKKSTPHSPKETSADKPSDPSKIEKQSSFDAQLVGVSESVALVIKDLQIKLREKDEDIARLQRQKDRELKERDDKLKKLLRDSKKVEREKWELLKRARDAAERSLHLRTQLDMREGSLRGVQSELDRTRDELVSVKSANTSLRALLSDLRGSRPSSAEVGIQVDLNSASLRRNRSIELAFTQGGLSQEQELDRRAEQRMSSSSLGLNWQEGRWEREGISAETASLQDECRDMPIIMSNSQPLGSRESRRSRKKGALLSKMMRSSGKKGSKTSIASTDGLDLSQSSLIQGSGHSPMVGSPYHAVPSDLKQHWQVLEQAKATPFSKWDLQAVVAWLEAEMGMSRYSRAVSDRYPSGSALLSLTETDMEKKLNMSDVLHRRKLTLALQEKRNPQMVQFPHAGKIDHSWVAFEWAHDCGLAHLTEVLTGHLVDGRVLNSLTKEDLKKYLKITKRVDQLSFLSGVELLRMHDFNRQAIQEHRRQSQNALYWTNRDVADWLYNIDLQDYANNVIGGGVHGALLFLERGRFSSDHLANIIQIPTSKSQLRRHLAGKIASLFSEDIGGSLDPLSSLSSSATMLAYSPLNLSPANNNYSQTGSQSPHLPRKLPSGSTTPTDCLHPARKNSLGKRSSIQASPLHGVTRSPPGMRRTGSTPQSTIVKNVPAPSPNNFQRNQLESAERVRLSLRESALRSMRDDGPHVNRTVTPTVLSSTTV